MLKSIILPIFCFSTILISCQEKESVKNLLPVEKEKPNSDYKPAFAGQTRIQGYKTQTEYKVDVINKHLGRPWGIAQLPNQNFLITEKTGFINLVSPDGKYITKISGLPKVDSRGQGGLLDIVIDPDFENNQTIYWSFSEPYEKGNLTAVGKGVLSTNKIENVKIIFRATPSYDGRLHYGSRLAFDKSGNLFVSTGERSDLETRPLAQDLKAYLGKIIKIDKNGKPAAGNPFIGSNKAQPEIYSYGHRNPQGIAIHPETGELWETEMGPRGGDEINLIQPGKNYGWPTITYGIEYSGQKINNGLTKKDDLEQPIYYWDPVISPSGITFYTGNIVEWKNNLFIACLSGEKINRIILENNKVVGEERLLEDQNERFRDVFDGKDGNLYAVTDSGKLYRISRK
ncbi:PQQ-dependent sugar dehydrogenase [Epilithonimonas sp.]|uniref:PQQ-dependent sugar dehydrogenase n=1 Tax=Epilithonimonas sp. TaxID=2894511 RepID=UPI0028A272E4|nr:PQQ-dependent sugar dehydrogenase [Epilithonimonas sp.]